MFCYVFINVLFTTACSVLILWLCKKCINLLFFSSTMCFEAVINAEIYIKVLAYTRLTLFWICATRCLYCNDVFKPPFQRKSHSNHHPSWTIKIVILPNRKAQLSIKYLLKYISIYLHCSCFKLKWKVHFIRYVWISSLTRFFLSDRLNRK